MKKKMIIAVLTMSMVLGAGSASYAAEKAASCTDTAEYGQTMTAAQLCGAQTAQDFEALCKGQIDFETLCKAQNPGNTQNKNDKDNKEDQDDSSKNEQVSAGQSSMTSQVVNLVNSERAAQGLTALQKDSRLAALAQHKLAALCNAPDTGAAVQVKFADTGKPVHRLAVISGAGGSLFAEAIAEGADCLLTGEANHHHALDAKRLGLSLIAAGHYATEFPVTAAVAAALRSALPEVEVLVSTENRDPYTYL